MWKLSKIDIRNFKFFKDLCRAADEIQSCTFLKFSCTVKWSETRLRFERK